METYCDWEYHAPSDAVTLPPELPPLGDEYNDTYAGGKDEYENHSHDPTPTRAGRKQRERLRKALLLQMAAAISVVVTVSASFGLDPLGSNFLSGGSPSAPPAVEVENPEDGIVTVYVHVTYMPTGETYTPPSTIVNEAALTDAKAWVTAQGGDAEAMVLVDSQLMYTGLQGSDDLILVGDPDNLDNAYIAQGSLVKTYRRDDYYQAYAVGQPPAAADSAFPALPNLDPDFAGEYAWAGMGSEEYLVVDSHYLHAGTYYTDRGVSFESLPGASYNKATNTLTLNNYHGGFIDANLMGNGFRIELIGDNSLDQIKLWGAMYGGSATFTGSGSIKLNESGNASEGVGLYLECEDSPSCVMIDRQATVEVFGEYAIVIHRTTLEKAIYTLSPVTMTGGTYSTGEFVEYTVTVTDDNGNIVTDANGDPVTELMTVRDIAEKKGMALYDYSVVGSDGKPAKHVLFAPGQ